MCVCVVFKGCYHFSEDLLDYVCLQGQPVVRGGSVPRLSLYLSSQLMYGLVKVFEKQQHFLMGRYSYC